jgi:hypothetical protein
VWQALRTELHPQGVEVVTVALDSGGADAAGPWIDAANPEHPSLIDASHELDAALGVVNVPTGVWVDEEGVLVRPPEVAHPGTSVLRDMIAQHGIPSDGPEILREQILAATKIRVDPEAYGAALRDWAEKGSESRFALLPEEVVERSRPVPREVSEAAAHFELGVHLHGEGELEAARRHFRAAHALDPENWTYKRQAWSFEDPFQGPTEHYDSDWLSEIAARGHGTYYPLPEL